MGCGYPGLRLAPLLRQHPAPGDHLQGPGALTLTSRVQVPSLLLLGAGLGLLLAPAPASQMVAAVARHCGISGRQQQLVAELVTTTVVRELGEQLGCSCNAAGAAGVYTAVCRRGGGGGLGVRGAARGAGLHRGLQTQQALPRPGEGSHWPWSHCTQTTALVPRHPAPALEPGDRPPPHLPRHQRQDVPRHRRGDCSPVEPQLLQVRGCPLW